MNRAQAIIEWYEELCCEVDSPEEANIELTILLDDEGIYLEDGYEFNDGSKLLIDWNMHSFKAVV